MCVKTVPRHDCWGKEGIAVEREGEKKEKVINVTDAGRDERFPTPFSGKENIMYRRHGRLSLFLTKKHQQMHIASSINRCGDVP